MCRPGIVPGQKYSPATECVVLVGRIGAGAASPAWLVSPAGRRSPNYTIVPPCSCCLQISPSNLSSFLIIYTCTTCHYPPPKRLELLWNHLSPQQYNTEAPEKSGPKIWQRQCPPMHCFAKKFAPKVHASPLTSEERDCCFLGATQVW